MVKFDVTYIDTGVTINGLTYEELCKKFGENDFFLLLNENITCITLYSNGTKSVIINAVREG